MIYESFYWRRELTHLTGQFAEWSRQFSSDDDEIDFGPEVSFQIERTMFFAALAVRRLIDCQKSSLEAPKKKYNLVAHPATGKRTPTKISVMNHPELSEDYHLDQKITIEMTPYAICSEIIHSFALVPAVDQNNAMEGIFVCFERNQSKRVVRLGVGQWEGICRDFTADNPNNYRLHRDLDTGEYIRGPL